jgi:hypothetical protein
MTIYNATARKAKSQPTASRQSVPHLTCVEAFLLSIVFKRFAAGDLISRCDVIESHWRTAATITGFLFAKAALAAHRKGRSAHPSPRSSGMNLRCGRSAGASWPGDLREAVSWL